MKPLRAGVVAIACAAASWTPLAAAADPMVPVVVDGAGAKVLVVPGVTPPPSPPSRVAVRPSPAGLSVLVASDASAVQPEGAVAPAPLPAAARVVSAPGGMTLVAADGTSMPAVPATSANKAAASPAVASDGRPLRIVDIGLAQIGDVTLRPEPDTLYRIVSAPAVR